MVRQNDRPKFKEKFWSEHGKGGEITTNVLGFESVFGIRDYIENGLKKNTKYSAYINNQEARNWSGGVSFKECMEHLVKGNDKYTQMYLDGLKHDNHDSDEYYTGYQMDIEGVAYDMGAVVNGDPECCLNMGFPEIKRHLTICVSVDFVWTTPASNIRNRGLAIVNLVNTLITQGYILDLEVVYSHDRRNLVGNRDMRMFFKVNTDTQCISEFAFYMAPEFMRILCFLITEIHDFAKGGSADIGGLAGGAIGTKFLADLESRGTLYLGGEYDDPKMAKLNTIEEANKYITEKFNKYISTHKGVDRFYD